jgi:ketosteroid isomerase-like protein
MSEKNKAILDQANAAVARGDYEGFLAHCTDDVEWVFVGDTTPEREGGRASVHEDDVRPAAPTSRSMTDRGPRLRHGTGDIRVKDETGKVVHSAYCDVWRFRDGKIAGLRAYVVESAERAEWGPPTIHTVRWTGKVGAPPIGSKLVVSRQSRAVAEQDDLDLVRRILTR